MHRLGVAAMVALTACTAALGLDELSLTGPGGTGPGGAGATSTATDASAVATAGAGGQTGSGGQGGSGGTTAAMTGTGGAAASTSSGGEPCTGIDQCPGNEPECKACVSDACAPVAAGTPMSPSSQIPNDCLTRVCDGAGSVTTQNEPGDLVPDMNECTLDYCDDGQATHPPAPGGKLCNGQVDQCNGAGACVDCFDNGGCDEASVCSNGVCIPA